MRLGGGQQRGELAVGMQLHPVTRTATARAVRLSECENADAYVAGFVQILLHIKLTSKSELKSDAFRGWMG